LPCRIFSVYSRVRYIRNWGFRMRNRLIFFVTVLCMVILLAVSSSCITIIRPSDSDGGKSPQSQAQAPVEQAGNADWWKNQPDLKQEETAINTKIGQLRNAFAAKDLDTALKVFSVEERDKYRKLLSQSPDIMTEMAADLGKARLNYLSVDSTEFCRIAEYLIPINSYTCSIVFIKVDGQWMLKDF
jgi:hypothetical protein